jgi:multicomponent Na+:H+ antiporter subunit E
MTAAGARRGAAGAGRGSAALARAAMFFALWIILDQSAKPGNLLVGALATWGATWVSLRLLPASAGRVRVLQLAALLPRFLWQSVVAGVDVARRAFDPRLPLAPGFVNYEAKLPRGAARNAFTMISSLLPGSLPADEDERAIEYHALDTAQPMVEQLATEERVLGRALEPGRPHG